MAKKQLQTPTDNIIELRNDNANIFCTLVCTLAPKNIHVVAKIYGRKVKDFFIPIKKPIMQLYNDNTISVTRKFKISNFDKTQLTVEIKKCIYELSYVRGSASLIRRLKKHDKIQNFAG